MSALLASLPMHDAPPAHAANDALWSALAAALDRRGIAAPATLDRRAAYATIWTEPGLVFSQTCGYPFVTRLRADLRLVATPVYHAEGCEGARYRSALVVRADETGRTLLDFRGRRAAVNGPDSQSGMNTFRAAVAPLAEGRPFFAEVVVSGGHAASVDAVAAGHADIAAIDAVSLAMLRRHEPERAAPVRILGWTPAAPGLPFVTRRERTDAELAAMRAALDEVLADPALAAVRADLLLEGAEVLDEADYDAILAMERAAAEAGYPALA